MCRPALSFAFRGGNDLSCRMQRRLAELGKKAFWRTKKILGIGGRQWRPIPYEECPYDLRTCDLERRSDDAEDRTGDGFAAFVMMRLFASVAAVSLATILQITRRGGYRHYLVKLVMTRSRRDIRDAHGERYGGQQSDHREEHLDQSHLEFLHAEILGLSIPAAQFDKLGRVMTKGSSATYAPTPPARIM